MSELLLKADPSSLIDPHTGKATARSLRTATVAQVNRLGDALLMANQPSTLYRAYHVISQVMPPRIPNATYARALEASLSVDPDLSKAGKSAFQYLNASTITFLVDKHTDPNFTDDDKEELAARISLQFTRFISSLYHSSSFKSHLNGLAKTAIAGYLEEKHEPKPPQTPYALPPLATAKDEIVDRIITKEMQQEVRARLKILPLQQQRVIALRYGLVDGKEKSYREIAQITGESRWTMDIEIMRIFHALRDPRGHRLQEYLYSE
jgi:DNA-directed RNA polymerase specialized sigma24 family protein